MTVELKTGDTVNVRWPDKTETTETVITKDFSRTVSDHGKECAVHFKLPGVFLEARGLRVWIPLDEVEVQL